MRPSAQPFLWKWVLFAWEWKIISISKAEHLTSFWYRGPGELGNGLLYYNIIEAFNAAVNLNFIFIACAQGSRRQCLRDIFFFFTSQLCFCGRLPQQTTSEKRTQKFHTGDGSPGTKGFTWWKWIIGYNFGIDDGAESKFGASKELTVLKISKYKYCANKSRDKSRDHFAQNCKLLTNWWPV